MHQAHAIMYCTQQMIQGENFRNWLKTAKVFPLESFAVYGSRLHTLKHLVLKRILEYLLGNQKNIQILKVTIRLSLSIHT